MRVPRRLLIAATTALLSAAAVGLSACGSGADAATGDSGGAVLKLQDPGNAGPLAYAKREGILEKRLAAVNAKVAWGGSYASFTATADAVHAGSVNVLAGAISPVLGYLANSKDIRVFAVTDPVTDAAAPQTDGLVVAADSPIKSVADLVGKRVAVNKGGRGEYLLLLALQQANIPVDQVERVYLGLDQAASAFATGKVDAWWAIVNAYPQVVAKGARVLVHGRDLPDQDLSIVAARLELLQQHPEAVKVYLDVLRELTQQAKQEPEKFQNVFLQQGPTAITGDRLKLEIEKTRYAQVPRLVTDADGAAVTSVSDLFSRYGVVKDKVAPADVFLVLS
ncbi:ABC transporter substrate-binding protein [Hamadaea sp. NPDC051192]|uniref:ABC transporter substrate-binding protein n=1 Tax=Hamadaea sp. NPDC051192 TaxID=3154940 RepID=UPI003441EE2D